MRDRHLTTLETLSVLKSLGTPMSRATLYRRLADADFPKPVATRGTKNLWSYNDVADWHWLSENNFVYAMTETTALAWADRNAGIREPRDRRNADKIADRDNFLRLWRKAQGNR